MTYTAEVETPIECPYCRCRDDYTIRVDGYTHLMCKICKRNFKVINTSETEKEEDENTKQ